MSQILLNGTQQEDKRQRAQAEMHKIPFKRKKKYFYCGDGQTLEQVTQRTCGVSTFGDTQNPTWP